MASRASALASSALSRLFNPFANGKVVHPFVRHPCHASSKTPLSQPILSTSLQHRNFLSSCGPLASSPHFSSSGNVTSQPGSLLFGPCSRGSVVSTSSSPLPGQLEQRRFYQAALRPRLICPGCYFVWRHGRKHVECSDHPRHKQMKRVVKRKMWKEDYTSGDWVKALDFHKVHYRRAERSVDRTTMSHNWLAGKLGAQL